MSHKTPAAGKLRIFVYGASLMRTFKTLLGHSVFHFFQNQCTEIWHSSTVAKNIIL